jgi:hypothetical protein
VSTKPLNSLNQAISGDTLAANSTLSHAASRALNAALNMPYDTEELAVGAQP